MTGHPVRLGLRENRAQFALLVAINAFVGAMVGLERSTLPLIGRDDFGLTSSAAVLSFIVAFGIAKALTNLAAILLLSGVVVKLTRDYDLQLRAGVSPRAGGRGAAEAARRVSLRRGREEGGRMMSDEYVDRVSEVVTGIVRQAGDRNNVLVDLGKVEALLPRSEQVDGERRQYENERIEIRGRIENILARFDGIDLG